MRASSPFFTLRRDNFLSAAGQVVNDRADHVDSSTMGMHGFVCAAGVCSRRRPRFYFPTQAGEHQHVRSNSRPERSPYGLAKCARAIINDRGATVGIDRPSRPIGLANRKQAERLDRQVAGSGSDAAHRQGPAKPSTARSAPARHRRQDGRAQLGAVAHPRFADRARIHHLTLSRPRPGHDGPLHTVALNAGDGASGARLSNGSRATFLSAAHASAVQQRQFVHGAEGHAGADIFDDLTNRSEGFRSRLDAACLAASRIGRDSRSILNRALLLLLRRRHRAHSNRGTRWTTTGKATAAAFKTERTATFGRKPEGRFP